MSIHAYVAPGGWIGKMVLAGGPLPPPDPSTRVERPPVDTGWLYLSPSSTVFRDTATGYDVLKFRVRTVNGVDTFEIVRLDP